MPFLCIFLFLFFFLNVWPKTDFATDIEALIFKNRQSDQWGAELNHLRSKDRIWFFKTNYLNPRSLVCLHFSKVTSTVLLFYYFLSPVALSLFFFFFKNFILNIFLTSEIHGNMFRHSWFDNKKIRHFINSLMRNFNFLSSLVFLVDSIAIGWNSKNLNDDKIETYDEAPQLMPYRLEKILQNSRYKYVMAILLDVKNAFNTVWWSSFLQEFRTIIYPKRILIESNRNRYEISTGISLF